MVREIKTVNVKPLEEIKVKYVTYRDTCHNVCCYGPFLDTVRTGLYVAHVYSDQTHHLTVPSLQSVPSAHVHQLVTVR